MVASYELRVASYKLQETFQVENNPFWETKYRRKGANHLSIIRCRGLEFFWGFVKIRQLHHGEIYLE
jgi:hypothetical protein